VLSTSGEWMAYSTAARVRLLKVEGVVSGSPKLRRVALPDDGPVQCGGGGEVASVQLRAGGMNVYSVSGEGVSLVH
jgi:hypothetical protein